VRFVDEVLLTARVLVAKSVILGSSNCVELAKLEFELCVIAGLSNEGELLVLEGPVILVLLVSQPVE
jgi:hypothetical protein